MSKVDEYKILVSADTRKAVSGVKGLASSFKALGAAAAAAALVSFGKQVIDASKQMETFRNQLRLVTKDQADLERLMSRLTQAAVENRASFAATAELYQKLAVTTTDLNKSEDQLLTVTGKLSQALAVAGADAGTTNGVIRQFGQAMASGVVRGDEFNSIVEGLGPALAIMAEETGLNVGSLRKLAQQGKLTAEVMFNMLENSTALSASFNQMQVTTEQLETQLGDSFTASLAALGDASGITDKYRSSLKGLIRIFDQLSDRQGAVANMNLKQLEALTNTAAAIEELEARLANVPDPDFMSPDDMMNMTGAVEDRYAAERELLHVLRERLKVEKEQAETNKRIKEAHNAEKKAVNELLGDYQKLTAIYQNMDVDKFLTPQEKLNKQYDESAKLVAHLSGVLQVMNQENLVNTHRYTDVQDALKNAKIAMAAYGKEIEEANLKQYRLNEQKKIDQELTYLGLRGQTETIQVLRERIQNLNEFKNTLNMINQAELDGLLTTQQAADLKLAAEEKYTQGYKRLAEERAAAVKAEELQKMRDFIGAEDKRKQEAETRRTYELMQQGKTAEQAKSIAEFENKTAAEKAQFGIDQSVRMFKALGQHNKAAFAAYKAFAIAQAIQNTYLGASQALRAYPPPFSFLAAAAQVAAGLAQVAQIRSQNYSGRAEGGPVTGGSSFMVGERGPEIFTPQGNGTITPNNQIGASGPVTVNFNIEATDAEGIDEMLMQRRGLITSIIREAMEDNGMRSIV